jgi:inorganic pyrophosphatase
MSIVWNTGAAAMRFRLKNKKKKRIKHNDLTHYFIRDHKDLPPAYLRSCEKFFKELSTKRQASSTKQQASSNKQQAPAGLNLNTIKLYK